MQSIDSHILYDVIKFLKKSQNVLIGIVLHTIIKPVCFKKTEIIRKKKIQYLCFLNFN